MQAMGIFKMELWKNCRDKGYLTIAGIVGAMGLVVSILGFFFPLNPDNPNTMVGSGTVLFLTFLTVVGYAIVGFLYPLHLLSLDYRNRVMNLMVASGVKRSHLYFAKIGSTIISTVVVMFAMSIVPVVLFFFNKKSLFYYIFQSINLDKQMLLMLVWLIVSYLSMLIILTFSVILVKGSFVSIIIMYVIQQVCNLCASPLYMNYAQKNMDTLSDGKIFIMQISFALLQILIFGYLGLRLMKKQNF